MTFRGQLKREIRFRTEWRIRPKTLAVVSALLCGIGLVLWLVTWIGTQIGEAMREGNRSATMSIVGDAFPILLAMFPFAVIGFYAYQHLSSWEDDD